jgi:hypothetical protein
LLTSGYCLHAPSIWRALLPCGADPLLSAQVKWAFHQGRCIRTQGSQQHGILDYRVSVTRIKYVRVTDSLGHESVGVLL